MEALLSKAVARLGRKGVWRVVHAVRHVPAADRTADGVRAALRAIGLFVDDADYRAIAGDAPGAPFDADAFVRRLLALLPPRRRHVVDLVVRKLDPDGSGFVPLPVLRAAYDTQRHPHARTRRDPVELAADFMQGFEAHSSDGGVTADELVAYYLGVSCGVARDEEFELLCIRSFSLDRPRPQHDEEEGAGAGERVSRASLSRARALGTARTHPLYQTTASAYGKDCAQVPYDGRFGRTHCFTKHAPAQHSGGATSMNM